MGSAQHRPEYAGLREKEQRMGASGRMKGEKPEEEEEDCKEREKCRERRRKEEGEGENCRKRGGGVGTYCALRIAERVRVR